MTSDYQELVFFAVSIWRPQRRPRSAKLSEIAVSYRLDRHELSTPALCRIIWVVEESVQSQCNREVESEHITFLSMIVFRGSIFFFATPTLHAERSHDGLQEIEDPSDKMKPRDQLWLSMISQHRISRCHRPFDSHHLLCSNTSCLTWRLTGSTLLLSRTHSP